MRVEKATVESYGSYLKDKHRPPSKGGNTRAWHQHVLVIDGEKYSFLAAYAGKFVYKGETVSFDWEWDESKRYRNIDRSTVVAWDAAGNRTIRGNRSDKTWRTADTRLPGRDD
jgi:hypothetical protein